MQDQMLLTHIINHLQTLNLTLQGKNKIVSDLTQTIFSFQSTIRVFQSDILSRNFIHFPNFSRRLNTFLDIEIKDHKLEEYKVLLDNFLARFDDLRKLKPCFAFLANSFMVDVVNDGCRIPEPLVTESSAVEMELMELPEDLGLQMIHKSQSTTEFWKQVPGIKYPELKKTRVRLISMFSTKYCCESLYSVMEFVQSLQTNTCRS
ncbi:general transcription factor II-I repeat domain-containing protein 2-like [Oratosquilla oratoria]|uniref:general transcription factor II-I repeat domain-containing protein 2-like n=1 Tax=Oratosquilla oratoria TaxID=337810 RepID=UPI003F76ED36